MDAKCDNCSHHIYDTTWGEYKCGLKKRTCTESELIMGCSDYKQIGTRPDEPVPEMVVRSGATFTPHVSEDGLLSWTNDKGLENPKPVNIKPVKGKDYFTPEDQTKMVKELSETITEEWTFIMKDGSVVTKKVAIG